MPSPELPERGDLLDAAPCGLMVADDRGLLVDVNGTICKWLRSTREELVGHKRFQDLLTMGGRIFHQTHLAPLLRMQGSVAEVKLELRRGDGSTLPVMVNLAERAWRGATILYIAVFSAEDRHKYERELLLQRRRAEELAAQHARDQEALAAAHEVAKDRALYAEQMMGIVSHDLRNPLSVIRLSAAILERGELSAQQRTVVDRVQRSVSQAERLLADLLDFTQARLGSGLSIHKVETDLHQAIGDSLSHLQVAFPARSIQHLSQGPGLIHADPHRISQAVGNLVANACNHGAQDKPVTVATRSVPGEFRIEVRNEGRPIPPELQKSLFEPLVRGAHGEGARGIGLGLYIVREIARAHGGTVSVRSTAEDGTMFAIHLPAPQLASHV